MLTQGVGYGFGRLSCVHIRVGTSLVLRHELGCFVFTTIFEHLNCLTHSKQTRTLFCFCSFNFSCPILQKDNFVKQFFYCIVLSHEI